MPRAQRRVLLTDCRLTRQAGQARAQVSLSGSGGAIATGNAERADGAVADLWCGAEATVAALRQTLRLDADALWLKDVVTLDISDGAGVAVALTANTDGTKRRLFGLAQAETDRARSAAKAVLAATNRFLESG